MQHATTRTATGTTTVALTLLGWTSVPLFLRYFADSIDAWTANGWRYGVSALLWAPVIGFAAMRSRLPRGIWKAALVPALVNSIGQVTFCWGHYKIDPGLFSFGLRSQMVWAALGAYALFAAERPVIRSRGYLLGLLLLLGGTAGALLLGDPTGGTALRSPADYAAGIALSLVTGALFAAYALAVRYYMRPYRSLMSFAVISQYTAAAMVGLMLLLGRGGGSAALEIGGGNLALLIVSGIIGIALGHVLYYMSMARLGVAVTTGVLQLHPFTVALVSLVVFGEVLSPVQWVSGLLAVAGALLMLRVQGALARRAGLEAAGPAPAGAAAPAARRR